MHPAVKPGITIITVSLNNREGLEKTIRSVVGQHFRALEHIIIDGGSTDGSDELKIEFDAGISQWISEPDKGPYDAMNKGVRAANGQWIIFLNAGDVFYGPESLAAISPYLQDDRYDAIYGDSLADYGDVRIYRKAGDFRDIWKGMVFSHQALAMRSALLKENNFNLAFPVIADYELILRCLKDPSRVKQIPVLLAICDSSGISNKGQAGILCQYYRQAEKARLLHSGRKMNYLLRFCLLFFIDLAKRFLPAGVYLGVIKMIKRKDLV